MSVNATTTESISPARTASRNALTDRDVETSPWRHSLPLDETGVRDTAEGNDQQFKRARFRTP
jgi:hypothetical protein